MPSINPPPEPRKPSLSNVDWEGLTSGSFISGLPIVVLVLAVIAVILAARPVTM